MNRIAICNEIFEPLDFSQTCKMVSGIGYEGLELSPITLAKDIRKLSSANRRKTREIARSNGLEIMALHWLLASPPGMHIAHPDQRVYRRTFEYFKELISFSRDLGAKILVFGSPAQRSIEPSWDGPAAKNQIVRFFRDAGDLAGEQGITIGFEPLGPQITNIGGVLEDALALIGEINHPQVKIHLDFSAMVRDPLSVASQIDLINISDLLHVHVNDPNQLGPGMGDLAIEPILRQLWQKGYEGWYSVESFAKNLSPQRIAFESFANLTEILSKFG